MNTEAIKKLEGKGIECLNLEHGKQIIDFYKSIGIDIMPFSGSATKEQNCLDRYYGLLKDKLYFREKDEYTEIITLDQAKKLVEEKTFPRVMMVWRYKEEDAVKRVVIDYKAGVYICWANVETIEESKSVLCTTIWRHAKEVEEETPQPIELTIEQIAEKFGVTAEQIKIKK